MHPAYLLAVASLLSPTMPGLLTAAALTAPAAEPTGASAATIASARLALTDVQAPLGCVNTVVVRASAPTGPAMVDGGGIVFRDNIAPGHGTITSLYIAPGGYPVATAGQRVRVCFLNIPKAQGACDPAHDPRGREFLVINLEPEQRNQADVYENAEHGCGGA